MFSWIIPNLIGKAGYTDLLPQNIERIVVAAEYAESQFPLVDEVVDNPQQRNAFHDAVELGLRLIRDGQLIVFVCQQGRSRSVTVALVTAALFLKDSFANQYKLLRAHDDTIRENSEILTVAQRLYPGIF